MHQSSGISSRGSSRIPTKPSAVPEKDSQELPGPADTTDNNEPIKKFSGRSGPEAGNKGRAGWRAKMKFPAHSNRSTTE
jgi:hypothetical protein